MLDVSWVDEQIERVRCATATMQTARDYALLCIARDHLSDMERQRDRPMGDAPTLEQVEAALARITVSTEDERRRADDAKLWARTLGGK